MSSNWYETFFDGLALEFWRSAVTPEMTRADADFLMDRLRLAGDSHVLDIPCGDGRHALELARRGVSVTGIDIAPAFVHEARAGAADGCAASFSVGDMRHPPFPSIFDAAYCFGNSFGYTDHAGTEAFLAAVARVLRPGARFALDTGAAAEVLIPVLLPRFSITAGGVEMAVENTYVPEESRLDTMYTFTRHDAREIKCSRHHVYTAAEIRRLLAAVGLSIEGMWSSTTGEPFSIGSPRLLLVAQKAL